MNIFERENAWLGAADFVAGHDTLESFLSQARMIRRRLGRTRISSTNTSVSS